MSRNVFIGVDGGGTKTQVFAIDLEARAGRTTIGEASNVNSVGWDTGRDRILALIDQALHQLGRSREDIAGVAAGLAGIDRKDQVDKMQAELEQHIPDAGVQVSNDALAALSAGTRGTSGVVLIAGTGSISVGESDDGSVRRAGGFGYLIGDEGSGFELGRNGLLAAIQSFEGRGPKTALWEVAAEYFRAGHPQDLIPVVYGSNHPVGTVASFAQQVVRLSEQDAVAEQLIDASVAAHAQLVEAVYRQFSGGITSTVVLAGGLYTHGTAMLERLSARLPERTFTVLTRPPAAGAALRAMLRGVEADSGDDKVAIWESVVDTITERKHGGDDA